MHCNKNGINAARLQYVLCTLNEIIVSIKPSTVASDTKTNPPFFRAVWVSSLLHGAHLYGCSSTVLAVMPVCGCGTHPCCLGALCLYLRLSSCACFPVAISEDNILGANMTLNSDVCSRNWLELKCKTECIAVIMSYIIKTQFACVFWKKRTPSLVIFVHCQSQVLMNFFLQNHHLLI